jgi:hypothetical protein
MRAKVLALLKVVARIILFTSVPFKAVVSRRFQKVQACCLKRAKARKDHNLKKLNSFRAPLESTEATIAGIELHRMFKKGQLETISHHLCSIRPYS